MGRQKTYDRDTAVKAAMVTFWKSGYANVGVRQIGDETAINRFALQTDFGGKKGLFLEVLEKYLEISRETVLKPLYECTMDGIIAFFEAVPSASPKDPRCSGCLMVNTVIENAELNMDEVQAIARAHYAEMELLFEQALSLAMAQGYLKPDIVPADAARGLLTYAMGLEVFIRMQADTSAVQQQVDFIVAEIKGWQSTARTQ